MTIEDEKSDALAAGGADAETHARRRPKRQREEPLFILRAELKRLVPYSIQHIGRMEKRFQFPQRVIIGTNRVAWVRSEVMAWLRQRIAARPSPRPAAEPAAHAPPASLHTEDGS